MPTQTKCFAQITERLEKLQVSQQQLQKELALWDSGQFEEVLLSNRRIEMRLARLEQGQEKLLHTIVPGQATTIAVDNDQACTRARNPIDCTFRSHACKSGIIGEGSFPGPRAKSHADAHYFGQPISSANLDAQEFPRQNKRLCPDATHYAAPNSVPKNKQHRIHSSAALQASEALRRAKRRRKTKKGRCVVLSSNPILEAFNMVVLIAILVGAWADTLNLAQSWDAEGKYGPFGEAWEWIAFIVYSLDIFASMVTAYKNKYGIRVTSQPRVLARYLRTWFAIDVFATIPWFLVSSALGGTRIMKLTKMVKTVRVVKAFKAISKTTALQKIQEQVDSLLGHLMKSGESQRMMLIAVRILQASSLFVGLILLEVHLFTCIVLSYATGGSLLWYYEDTAGEYLQPWFRYFAVMRWATVTLLTGVTSQSPLGLVERHVDAQAFQFCMVVLSGMNFMLGLGIFSHSQGSEEQDQYFQLRSLQLFLRQHPHVSYSNRSAVLSFFYAQLKMRSKLRLYQRIADLPLQIRAPVSIDMHQDIVSKVAVFLQFEKEDDVYHGHFFSQICELLEPQFHLDKETVVMKGVPFEAMFFTISGELIEEKTETSSMRPAPIIFGQQCLFAPDLRADSHITTALESELLLLKREAFEAAIASDHKWYSFVHFIRNLVCKGSITLEDLVTEGLADEELEEFESLNRSQSTHEVTSEQLGISCAYLVREFGVDVEKQIQEDPYPKSFTEFGTIFWPQDSVGTKPPGFMGSASRICPRDGLEGCAIVDALAEKSRKATHFVSWCWLYSLLTVASALELWTKNCGIDASEVFLWICFFCNNQRRMLEGQQTGSLTEVFSTRLMQIGHMIVLLDRTTDSVYTSRVWCIFEIYKVIENKLTMTVALPAEVKHEFEQSLMMGQFTGIAQSLTYIDAEEAKATKLEDEVAIKNLIRNSVGFAAVNESVKSALTSWLALAFEDCLKKNSISLVTQHIFGLMREENGLRRQDASELRKGASRPSIKDASELQFKGFVRAATRYPELMSYLELDAMDLEKAFDFIRRARDLDDHLKGLNKSELDVFFNWLRNASNGRLLLMREAMQSDLQTNIDDLHKEISRKRNALAQLSRSSVMYAPETMAGQLDSDASRNKESI